MKISTLFNKERLLFLLSLFLIFVIIFGISDSYNSINLPRNEAFIYYCGRDFNSLISNIYLGDILSISFSFFLYDFVNPFINRIVFVMFIFLLSTMIFIATGKCGKCAKSFVLLVPLCLLGDSGIINEIYMQKWALVYYALPLLLCVGYFSILKIKNDKAKKILFLCTYLLLCFSNIYFAILILLHSVINDLFQKKISIIFIIVTLIFLISPFNLMFIIHSFKNNIILNDMLISNFLFLIFLIVNVLLFTNEYKNKLLSILSIILIFVGFVLKPYGLIFILISLLILAYINKNRKGELFIYVSLIFAIIIQFFNPIDFMIIYNFLVLAFVYNIICKLLFKYESNFNALLNFSIIFLWMVSIASVVAKNDSIPTNSNVIYENEQVMLINENIIKKAIDTESPHVKLYNLIDDNYVNYDYYGYLSKLYSNLNIDYVNLPFTDFNQLGFDLYDTITLGDLYAIEGPTNAPYQWFGSYFGFVVNCKGNIEFTITNLSGLDNKYEIVINGEKIDISLQKNHSYHYKKKIESMDIVIVEIWSKYEIPDEMKNQNDTRSLCGLISAFKNYS